MSKLHTIAPRVENVVLRHAGVYRPYPFVMDPACKGHIIPCTGFSDDYTRAMHDTRNTWFMPGPSEHRLRPGRIGGDRD